MKTSEKTDQIYSAIFKLQQSMKPIPKTKEGQQGNRKFKYAPLDEVMEILKAHFSELQMGVIQAVDMEGIATRVFHAPSAQWIESDTFLNQVQPNMMTFGGEITYKKRYALCALLGIVSDDDNDAQAGNGVPRISATKGVLDNLPRDRQALMHQAAAYVIERVEANDVLEAHDYFYEFVDDESTALHSLLPSHIRTAIRKHHDTQKVPA